MIWRVVLYYFILPGTTVLQLRRRRCPWGGPRAFTCQDTGRPVYKLYHKSRGAVYCCDEVFSLSEIPSAYHYQVNVGITTWYYCCYSFFDSVIASASAPGRLLFARADQLLAARTSFYSASWFLWANIWSEPWSCVVVVQKTPWRLLDADRICDVAWHCPEGTVD